MAQTINQKWLGGDTATHMFLYLDSNELPIAVTSAKMQLRDRVRSATVVIEKDAIIDPDTGKISFIFTNVETGALVSPTRPSMTYVYDTEIVTVAGDTITLTAGEIKVSLTVTRPL